METKTLEKLFVKQLRETLNAENQLYDLLPGMARSCFNQNLKDVIQDYYGSSRDQIKKIEKVLTLVEHKRRDEISHNIEELLDQIEDVLEDSGEAGEVDACIINLSQKIAHYQIACYSTLVNYSKMLGIDEAEEMLQQNLDKEYDFDNKLDKVLEEVIQLFVTARK